MIKKEVGAVPKNLTFSQALIHIEEYFNGDRDLALKFWMTPNKAFNDMTPFQVVKSGQGRKLMKFIKG